MNSCKTFGLLILLTPAMVYSQVMQPKIKPTANGATMTTVKEYEVNPLARWFALNKGNISTYEVSRIYQHCGYRFAVSKPIVLKGFIIQMPRKDFDYNVCLWTNDQVKIVEVKIHNADSSALNYYYFPTGSYINIETGKGYMVTAQPIVKPPDSEDFKGPMTVYSRIDKKPLFPIVFNVVTIYTGVENVARSSLNTYVLPDLSADYVLGLVDLIYSLKNN